MAQGGLLGYLIGFAVVAGIAIALGLIFGIFNNVASQLYYTEVVTTTDPATGATTTSTVTHYYVPQEFRDAISLAESLGGTGVLLAVAALVVGLAMTLVWVIRANAGA